MTKETITYNEEKLAELILYIGEQTRDDETFGATKMNKTLFFADFLHYAATGRPITGAEYQKLPFGSAPRRLLPVRRQLIANDAATYDRSSYLGRFSVKRLLPKRGANMSMFNETETRFVDEVLALISDGTATSASDLSHREVGWQLAQEGETIPYETVWLSYEEPTASDRRRARVLAEKFNIAA